ncbi:P-loop NTPase family protein, partial [Staphylococcus epidermidis]
KHIHIHIHEAQFIPIIRPSASPKTTLINIFPFIHPAYQPQYFFNNHNYQKTSHNNLPQIPNHTLPFLFHNFKFIQNNTILQNLTIPLIYNPFTN